MPPAYIYMYIVSSLNVVNAYILPYIYDIMLLAVLLNLPIVLNIIFMSTVQI